MPESLVANERSVASRLSQSAFICVSKSVVSSCLYGWARKGDREPSPLRLTGSESTVETKTYY